MYLNPAELTLNGPIKSMPRRLEPISFRVSWTRAPKLPLDLPQQVPHQRHFQEPILISRKDLIYIGPEKCVWHAITASSSIVKVPGLRTRMVVLQIRILQELASVESFKRIVMLLLTHSGRSYSPFLWPQFLQQPHQSLQLSWMPD